MRQGARQRIVIGGAPRRRRLAAERRADARADHDDHQRRQRDEQQGAPGAVADDGAGHRRGDERRGKGGMRAILAGQDRASHRDDPDDGERRCRAVLEADQQDPGCDEQTLLELSKRTGGTGGTGQDARGREEPDARPGGAGPWPFEARQRRGGQRGEHERGEGGQEARAVDVHRP